MQFDRLPKGSGRRRPRSRPPPHTRATGPRPRQTLFDALMRPDFEAEPARARVAEAANLLEIGEYQLLQLAYRARFGRDLDERTGDRLFETFMIRSQVPDWATHYALGILDLEQRGQLDARNPAYHVYDRRFVTHMPDGARHFAWAAMIIAILLSSGLYVSVLSVDEVTSVLPPYFERDELPNGN